MSSGTEAAMSARPAGPGVHRPGPRGEVRRLLPRALRHAPGRWGERRGRPRPPRFGRGSRRRPWPTPSSCPTTSCPSSTSGWRASSSSRWRPTWAWWPRRRDSSRGCAGACDDVGRAPRVRRGHHRVPGGARGDVGAIRGGAGPVVLRQGDRRRAPGGRLRGPARRACRAGTGRARLPGGHAVGEPPRHRGRAGRARDRDRRRLRRACPRVPGVWRRLSRPPSPVRGSPSRSRWWGPSSACSSEPSP